MVIKELTFGINHERYDTNDVKIPRCDKCARILTILRVKDRKTGAYVNQYFCGSCNSFKVPIWVLNV